MTICCPECGHELYIEDRDGVVVEACGCGYLHLIEDNGTRIPYKEKRVIRKTVEVFNDHK